MTFNDPVTVLSKPVPTWGDARPPIAPKNRPRVACSLVSHGPSAPNGPSSLTEWSTRVLADVGALYGVLFLVFFWGVPLGKPSSFVLLGSFLNDLDVTIKCTSVHDASPPAGDTSAHLILPPTRSHHVTPRNAARSEPPIWEIHRAVRHVRPPGELLKGHFMPLGLEGRFPRAGC